MAENTNTANTANNAPVTVYQKALVMAKETTTWIQGEVEKGLLSIPEGYNLGNELSLALSKIAQTADRNGIPAFDVCTKASILQALKDMATQGWSISKSHCYPIVYKNQLKLQSSYFGTLATLKLMFPEYKVMANVIFKDDTYDYIYNEDTACYEVHNLKSSLENRDKEVVGAFGFIKDITTGKTVYSEVMNRKEIQKCWDKSTSKQGATHDDFPQEMAKKSLINRMCKPFIKENKSVNPLVAEAYLRSVNGEYTFDEEETKAPVNVKKEKAIRERSRGNSGLKDILSAEEATYSEKAQPNAEDVQEPSMSPEEDHSEVAPPTDEDGNGMFDMDGEN